MRITGITVPVSNSLQQLLQDDTICLDEVLDVVNMAKNIQAIKKKHPYPIKYTEKSGWYTFVDDVTAPTGKKLMPLPVPFAQFLQISYFSPSFWAISDSQFP